jgi:hypothetical protein
MTVALRDSVFSLETTASARANLAQSQGWQASAAQNDAAPCLKIGLE